MDNRSYTHTRSSEELRDANVNNVNVTPPNVVPRLPRVSTGLGRGALLSSMLEHDMIATPVDSPSIKNTSQSGTRCDTSAFRGENYGFVQSDQPNQWQTMADLMKQLGSEIGNQIAASLSSAGQNVQRDHLSAQHPSAQPPDLSNLNLVIRHQDIKEPPTFRGDKTDRCTIGEWEELMQTYLNKKGYSVSLIDSHHRDKQSSSVERALQTEEKPSGAWCMTRQQAPDSGQSSGLDPALLSKAVSLLEQIILSQKEQEPRAEQVKTSHGESSIYSDSCRVCKALDHTTKTHCFKEGLCFVCYKTGHRGFECPKRKPVKQGTTRRSSGPDHPLKG